MVASMEGKVFDEAEMSCGELREGERGRGTMASLLPAKKWWPSKRSLWRGGGEGAKEGEVARLRDEGVVDMAGRREEEEAEGGRGLGARPASSSSFRRTASARTPAVC